MKVYLCEKPSQGKTFAKALGLNQRGDGCLKGGDTIVTWCIGHLIQQLEPKDYDEKYKQWKLSDLPIIPPEWKMKKNPKVQAQFSAVSSILKKLTEDDTVYISTDADAEGELIGVEMLEYTNCKAKRKRIWNKSLDDISLRESLDNPLDANDTYPLYLSALSRSRADWISGMNLTIAISAVNKGLVDGFFSVGRVQTPTLNLIVMRDLFIENFKPQSYFELKGVFDVNDTKVETKWKAPKDKCEEGKYFMDEDAIKAVKEKVSGKTGSVTKYDRSLKKKDAPVGYSLSEITKVSNSKFGFTADQTLKVMQSLYEDHKLCTYPRTDCDYLPTAMLKEVDSVLDSIQRTDPNNQELNEILGKCNRKKKSKIWNDKKVSAHHAIIPTRVPGDITALNDAELKLYTLVRNRYIAQFLPEYEYYASKIEITVENEIFEVNGNVPHLQGWREIEGKSSEKVTELPALNEGDDANCISAKIEGKKTKPPARYNDASIIEDMKSIGKFIEDPKMKKLVNENEGIGTEATRANILKTLISRGFVKREKKSIISTEKGRALISISPRYLKDPEMSAYWEQELDNISKQKQTYEKFIGQQITMLKKILQDVNDGKCTLQKGIGFDYYCEDCDGGLKKIKSKAGKNFWVHSAKTTCETFYADSRGKPGNKIEKVEQGDTEHKCEACETVLIKRKGDHGFYWACPNYKVCKSKTLPDDNGKPGVRKERVIEKTDHKCPDCDVGYLVQRESNRNGKKSVFWGCNNFPKCRYSAFDDDGKPKEKSQDKK